MAKKKVAKKAPAKKSSSTSSKKQEEKSAKKVQGGKTTQDNGKPPKVNMTLNQAKVVQTLLAKKGRRQRFLDLKIKQAELATR